MQILVLLLGANNTIVNDLFSGQLENNPGQPEKNPTCPVANWFKKDLLDPLCFLLHLDPAKHSI